jgi:hypothetical protein
MMSCHCRRWRGYCPLVAVTVCCYRFYQLLTWTTGLHGLVCVWFRLLLSWERISASFAWHGRIAILLILHRFTKLSRFSSIAYHYILIVACNASQILRTLYWLYPVREPDYDAAASSRIALRRWFGVLLKQVCRVARNMWWCVIIQRKALVTKLTSFSPVVLARTMFALRLL